MFKNLSGLKFWDKSFLNSSDNCKRWKAGAITKWSPAKALCEDRRWGGEIPGRSFTTIGERSTECQKWTNIQTQRFINSRFGSDWIDTLTALLGEQLYEALCGAVRVMNSLAVLLTSLVKDLLPWAQPGCTQSYLLLTEKPLTGWSGIPCLLWTMWIW